MINKIKDAIYKSQNIAVLCHTDSDGDALGSCLAFSNLMRLLNKNVHCFIGENIEERLKFIGGDFIVFNESDQIDEFDLCVALDCGSVDRLGKRISIFNASKLTINIDHHGTNTMFADINYVDGQKCATAEILAELFRELEFKIDKSVAFGLYVGIISDSGCLKFSSTTPKTLRTVAELMEFGLDHSEITRRLFDCSTINQLKIKGILMGKIETYLSGRLSMIVTDKKFLDENGISEDDAKDLVDIPKQVSTAEIAAEIKERGGKIRLSLRSNGNARVDKIAVSFGGGGHVRAAGATLDFDTIDDAKAAVIKACCEEIEESC